MKIDYTKIVRAERQDIAPGCKGCNRVDLEINKCNAYVNPAILWRDGNHCPLCSNWEAKIAVEAR